MKPKELEELKKSLTETIIKTVNGKIDKLTIENRETKEALLAYIKEDNQWKEKAEPVIEMGNNARGASKVALYFSGTIIAFGGAYEIIRNFFKK